MFVFLIELNTFSWAKLGTSYHSFPFVSTQSKTPIILAALIVLVSNFIALVKVNCSVLTVADIAFLSFFNKKYVGLTPDIW